MLLDAEEREQRAQVGSRRKWGYIPSLIYEPSLNLCVPLASLPFLHRSQAKGQPLNIHSAEVGKSRTDTSEVDTGCEAKPQT